MLILARKRGESVVIGDGPTQIRLIVVGVDRGTVQVGIECDRSVPIWRADLSPEERCRGRQGGAP